MDTLEQLQAENNQLKMDLAIYKAWTPSVREQQLLDQITALELRNQTQEAGNRELAHRAKMADRDRESVLFVVPLTEKDQYILGLRKTVDSQQEQLDKLATALAERGA